MADEEPTPAAAEPDTFYCPDCEERTTVKRLGRADLHCSECDRDQTLRVILEKEADTDG